MTRPEEITAALSAWEIETAQGHDLPSMPSVIAAGDALARLLRAANPPAGAERATDAVCPVCKGSRVAHEWGFDDPQPCKFCAEKPATPAAGEDEALLRRMHQVDLNLNCSSHLAVHAMLDVLREAAARIRALRADVARERDWRVQAEAERDRVLLRDDDALAEARAALAAEKIRADDLAAWVDHYRTKEASALARAEAAESATKAAVKKEREICAVMCERHGFSSAAALIRARAAGEGGEKP